MNNALINYLNRRLQTEILQSSYLKPPGPVITISREVGCNGIKLAELIAAKLNHEFEGTNWKVLSKDVFHESARELDLHPEKIRKLFKQTDKFVFDEIIKAFNTRSFKSERRIIKTVIDIVYTFASDGYCILVGRAGHIIARDIENALHLRLFAPLEYRIRNIMEKLDYNREQAFYFIKKIEKERIAFRKAIRAEQLHEEYFDMAINRASFSDQDTVDLIFEAIKKKNILRNVPARIQYY